MNLYSFADFLQHYNQKNGLNSSTLERLLFSFGLKFGRDTVRKWIKGQRKPNPFVMTKVCRALGGQTIILPSGEIMVAPDDKSDPKTAYLAPVKMSNNLDNSGGAV